MTSLAIVLNLVGALLSLPVAILFVEVLSALVAGSGNRPILPGRPIGFRVAVLVPAHDEEEGIGATVSGIAKQLGPTDRLIVVVDNCSDATAERARAAGAEIITRFDPQRRGKGYALDFGVRQLESDPPDVVLVVDADCRLGPGAVDALVACCHVHNRAVQARYRMHPPANSDAKRRVASFAWIVKNHVRPKGLAALGLPCQLMGTGMALPWIAIRHIDLATGSIVEDVEMGLGLAAAGFAPIYCPEALVESDFPTTEVGFAIQRRRWEAGALSTAMRVAPANFVRGLARLNGPLMVVAADLMVPPLMMLLLSLLLGLVVSVIFVVAGGSAFAAVAFSFTLLFLLLTLVLAWLRFGRDTLRPIDVLSLPGVFIDKLGLYLAMWRGRGAGWVRTDRR